MLPLLFLQAAPYGGLITLLVTLLVLAWAVLGIIFEFMYGRTYIVVRSNKDNGD